VALLIPFLLVAVGSAGYALIEPEYTLFDALYMTVITLTTVGYEETKPLSTAGRVFTMFLLLGGVFTLFYAASATIRLVVSGELRSTLGRQRMQRQLVEMNGHLIVCGYGRMGRLVGKEFAAQKLPFVVIEQKADLLEDFASPHGVALHGDATSDDVLRQAGVERARALVAVVASDADNLFITMSARLLNDKLLIVARAGDEQCERKLLRAGANRVISPYVIGGAVVARAVLRPHVLDFIELATRTEHLELQIEEMRVAPGSLLAGIALRDSQVRQDLGIIVVAVKKPSGQMVFNPPPDTVLGAGDILISLGPRQQLDELQKLARG
jgi:voltage-gated potassium channel